MYGHESLIKDIDLIYRDPLWGLIGDGVFPTHPSGNSMLYEGHLFNLTKGATEIELIWAEGTLQVKPGLINRKPNAKDEQRHDDYTGLVMFGDVIAEDVLAYGQRNYGFYDNNNPDAGLSFYLRSVLKSPSYLRFNHFIRPGQRAHYKICAERKIGVVEALIWSASIVTTALTKQNESGKLLDHLKLEAAKEYRAAQSRLVRSIIGWTRKFFYKRVDIAEAYSIYFSSIHPFAKAAKEIYKR